MLYVKRHFKLSICSRHRNAKGDVTAYHPSQTTKARGHANERGNCKQIPEDVNERATLVISQ